MSGGKPGQWSATGGGVSGATARTIGHSVSGQRPLGQLAADIYNCCYLFRNRIGRQVALHKIWHNAVCVCVCVRACVRACAHVAVEDFVDDV